MSESHFPAGALYMVATPIGNLADITLRAIDCLRLVDAVAAEDTRVAQRLLQHLGISKPCIAVHRHNEQQTAASIVVRLAGGERIAYVSDAGTPAISDPGARLAAEARAAGQRVIPIPGVSALTTALSAAGLPEGPFHFAGFLPAKTGAARNVLEALVNLEAHLVFYEAPHRVLDTVSLLAATFGDSRRLVIARELTKLFESIRVLPLAEARAWLEADANRQRGEFVLIVAAAPAADPALQHAESVLARLLPLLPLREAVDLAVELSGAPRKTVYALALELRPDDQR